MGEEPRDIYRECLDAADPTRRAANLHFPNYTFREGQEPIAYQVWRSEQSEFIHERCAKTIWDREFPLYADDIESARNLEPIVCDTCEEKIAEAIDRTGLVADSVEMSVQNCDRCNGVGEVEGYGGNHIYCGLCAGTGKKPRFKSGNIDLRT